MKLFPPLCRRQLAAHLQWPGAYAVAAAFFAVSGLSFCDMISRSLSERMQVGDLLFGSPLFQFAVLALIALITMRLFAEESRSGTLEALLTAPVTDTQLVAAKFVGAMAFYAVLCAAVISAESVILGLSVEPGSFDARPAIMGGMMLFLKGALYIAFGLLVSSLTRSQPAAGFICFAAISLAFFAADFQGLPSMSWAVGLPEYLSGKHAVLDFSRGMVDTRPVVLCLSGASFFLFVAVKAVEARHWK